MVKTRKRSARARGPLAARQQQFARGRESACASQTRTADGSAGGQHDVESPRQRLELGRQRVPCFAAHEHGVALGGVARFRRQVTEEGHLARKAPRQAAVQADAAGRRGGEHALRGRGVEQRQVKRQNAVGAC